ncbi:MAG: nitronate monooxygenase [Pseudomonadota bacterium]|nr:nitronate monooxygenase [Pseudomonadota bacterium]
MIELDPINISGRDVLPLVEGGKGIGVSDGVSAGSWANAGGVGTFSGVFCALRDATGRLVPFETKGKTRAERQTDLIDYAIKGAVQQAQIAHETAAGSGRIHMNLLWELGGAERILEEVLEKARGLIHGVTCGAGMPYRLSEIGSRFNVHVYPIVSSARVFNALWRRAYRHFADWLGAVVYEDPWLAGGHNGFSNADDPNRPEPAIDRVRALRQVMNGVGLHSKPIIVAGGVWRLDEWADWIDNPELGPIAFQFGTRPMLTRESPIPDSWKQRLLDLKPGCVHINRFSPTGFPSSAVKNDFLRELVARSERQISYRNTAENDFAERLDLSDDGHRHVFVSAEDARRAIAWKEDGNTVALKTPDDTLIFVTQVAAKKIARDRADCVGCLSGCLFSSWMQSTPDHGTGRRPDPRSFCIRKTLDNVVKTGDVDHELVFAGHCVHRFSSDPFYANRFIPTVKQLIEQIKTGK